MLRTSALFALVFCVIATHAWGQAPRPGTSSQQTAQPEEEEVDRLTSPLLRIPALGSTFAQTYPGTTAYPLELLGLLMAPMERRELNLLPSLAIAEEWTDNIFMNNANKQSEWITSFTPAVILLANRPHFQLATGFSNASEIYAKGTSSNDAFARQNFVIGAFYQPSPFVTLSLADTFMRDQSPDARAGGFSLNGQGSLTNSLAPAVGWQVAPQTRVDFSALYSLLRLDDPSTGVESDTYGFMTTLSHGFTRRFTGQVGYNFTYLDMRSGNGDNSTTHTP